MGSIDGKGSGGNAAVPLSEHFKNFMLGLAAICVPIVGYIYTNNENSRQIQASEVASVRQIQSAQTLAATQAKEAGAEKDRELAKSYVGLRSTFLSKRAQGNMIPSATGLFVFLIETQM